MANSALRQLPDGEVTLWVEDDRLIVLKAISSFGDPVELSNEEVQWLIETLQELAKKIE